MATTRLIAFAAALALGGCATSTQSFDNGPGLLQSRAPIPARHHGHRIPRAKAVPKQIAAPALDPCGPQAEPGQRLVCKGVHGKGGAK